MIIDFNAHYGCGLGMIRSFDPEQLLALERDSGVDMAVASDLSCVFGDNAAYDQPLPEGLIKFAGLRPGFKAGDIGSVKGVRLYPTYQAWDFGGSAMAELMSVARERGLIVQVCLRLQDPRVLLQQTPSAEVLQALDGLTAANKDIKFVVTGTNLGETSANAALFAHENVWLDLSHVQHPINSLSHLLKIVDSSRVLFGSNAPIFYPYAGVFRAMESTISDEVRERVIAENARELLGI